MAEKRNLNTSTLSGCWVNKLILQALSADAGTIESKFLGPVMLAPFKDALAARGNIAPHVDYDFADAPWSYILVLRSSGAILRCHGHHDLPLFPGMLVEFNAMRRHSLRQGRDGLTVWVPLDSSVRLSIDDAADRHRMKWA